MLKKNLEKVYVYNMRRRTRIAFSLLALASTITTSVSALAADSMVLTVMIPAGNGKLATEAKCDIAVTGTSFVRPYFTEAAGLVNCNIPSGKPGAGTKLTVGITNESYMFRNTTRYVAKQVQEYVLSSNHKNFLFYGTPPGCITGTTYAYKTNFAGSVAVYSAYTAKYGNARFSVTGPASSFKAASVGCSP